MKIALHLATVLIVFVTHCFGSPRSIEELKKIKLEADAKAVDSVEMLGWMSCDGVMFSGFLMYYDIKSWRNQVGHDKLKSWVESHQDSEGYLALMILLLDGVEVDVETRARILCSRLNDFELMNDWSLVNKDGDPQEMDFYNAACLRECGEIALKHLTPLLKNKAKVSYGTAFGSEMSITMDVHKMRKCDLVARYISQIKGLKWELGDFKTRDERWARLVK